MRNFSDISLKLDKKHSNMFIILSNKISISTHFRSNETAKRAEASFHISYNTKTYLDPEYQSDLYALYP